MSDKETDESEEPSENHDDISESVETARLTASNNDEETYSVTDGDETDVTKSESTEDVANNKTDSVRDLNSFSPFEFISTIYSNSYYWAIVKSTLLFILALKMARESKMLRIPMKDYKPFNRA